MKNDAFKELGGLVDNTLIGNNDKVMAYGIVNKVDEFVPATVHKNLRDSAKDW